MKYEGIAGESSVQGKEGYMELLSCTWGASRSDAASSSGLSGKKVAAVSDVSISRAVDSASAMLFNEALAGNFSRTVKIAFSQTGTSGPQDFMELELTNCGISSYQVSSGGNGAMEAMTLSFRQIQMTSHKVGDDLNATPNTAQYSLDN